MPLKNTVYHVTYQNVRNVWLHTMKSSQIITNLQEPNIASYLIYHDYMTREACLGLGDKRIYRTWKVQIFKGRFVVILFIRILTSTDMHQYILLLAWTNISMGWDIKWKVSLWFISHSYVQTLDMYTMSTADILKHVTIKYVFLIEILISFIGVRSSFIHLNYCVERASSYEQWNLYIKTAQGIKKRRSL